MLSKIYWNQELAVRNVLHVITYCPTLRDDILELAVHQMLLIDVRCTGVILTVQLIPLCLCVCVCVGRGAQPQCGGVGGGEGR